MKKITCPYPWDCGETFEPYQMSEYDYNFFKSAVQKEMTFMFIHCPVCSRRFEFNAVEWIATSMIEDPIIKIEKQAKKRKELIETLKEARIEIPPYYFDYLTGENFESKVVIIRGQPKFQLYNLEELCETVCIDNYSCLRIRGLKGYAESLKEIFGEEDSEEFSLSELSVCQVIGYENESILFVDYRDNNSLWIFHPDGADIESTKMTLEKISKRK